MQENLNNNSVNTVKPVIQTEQPKQNNFLVILLSILLIISCGIAGFFAYQTQRLVAELKVKNEGLIIKETPTPEPTSFTSPKPTATAGDPTATWKTYQNAGMKFSLKLPNDWTNKYKIVTKDKTVYFKYDAFEEDDYGLFWITRTTPTEWVIDQMPNREKIYSNDQYVYYSSRTLDIPYTNTQNVDTYVKMTEEIDQILSTFKFTN